MFTLRINGTTHQVETEGDTPLLWVLRDVIGLTGTKFGCGAAQCGACTVHVEGEAVRSCSVPISSVAGQQITTIEHVTADRNHPVVASWIEQQVPQCGYCQPGQIMTATALLKRNPKPTDADIDTAMTNICRCGSYAEIRKAIHQASALMAKG